MDSLRAAGFEPPMVHHDDGRTKQAIRAWIPGVRELMSECPNASAYFTVQDDVVLCRGVRDYLNTWPEDPAKIAICSPYSPAAYMASSIGWHKENRAHFLCSAQTWLIPAESLRRIVADLGHLVESDAVLRGDDFLIGRWAHEKRLNVWFHTPSLGQHIGIGNSAIGPECDCNLRQATDFVGEDYNCANL